MRGPERLERRSTAQIRAKTRGSAAKKGRARPRVPGGKALARQLFFTEQRLLDEARDGQAALEKLSKTSTSRTRTRSASSSSKTGVPSFLTAFREKTALDSAAATMVAQTWRCLGPFSTPHGQTYGQGPKSRPSVSGRIGAIAVDPSDDQHILIGAAGGGVWESKDAGKTWTPRTDDQPSLAMGAVAFDPQNPALVYAGTGEGDSTFPSDPTSILGVGLLRSTDGGTSWTVHATDPFERTGFYDIAIDPLDGNHLLAATSAGLFESKNGGSSWTQRRAQRTWSISIHPAVAGDPNSTKEIFAACADGLFRSPNGGTAWSKITLPGAPSSFDRVEVCHAPSDGNVVYVVAAGPPTIPDQVFGGSMPTPYLWRRSIFGGAFSRFAAPTDLQTQQAWYDWFAGVAPNNPDVLYVGGINAHKGVRSPAGTWSWTNISARTSGDSTHPDQHAIAFSPTDPNVVYLGNDGGIYRSSDGAVTWQSLNKGLCVSEVEFLTQHPQFEAWLIAGLQDNGTMRYQGQALWFHVADGDGGDCGINRVSPYTCFHTYYGMGVARSAEGGSWESWTGPPNFVIGPPVSQADDYPNGSLFYPPVEVNGPVVVQAGRAVFVSRNNGDAWTRIALPSGAGIASALAVPTNTRIYVGTTQGRVFRIDFSSGQWQAAVSLTQPVAGFISDVLVDSGDPNRIYVTYQASAGGRVFRSDNGGATWTNISAGLPDIGINAIEIDPVNTNNLFVAADLGVYRSTNSGTSWTAFNNGLPNALVKDLVFHQPSRLLRAGTQSRGVWEIAVDQATIPDVEVYLRDSAVDTGRVSPSPSDVDDPFHFGSKAFWFQSPDIKIDSPSFQRPSSSDIDFEVFADDESMLDDGIQFADGLQHESPQRNRTVRVFIQVHNRGVKAALNVSVKVFFANSELTLPNLPNGFWTNFPNNSIPVGSPWQAIAAHKTIAQIEAGKAEIVSFDWPVAPTVPGTVALLVITTADNDSLSTTELNVTTLVQNNKKCGLKNVTAINPSPVVGPTVRAVPIEVQQEDVSTPFSLELDQAAKSIVRGVILSKQLAKVARKAKLKRIKLTSEDKDELKKLLAAKPALKQKLDTSTAYGLGSEHWLQDIEPDGKGSETLVLLVNPEVHGTYGSIVQKASDGSILGGLTLNAV